MKPAVPCWRRRVLAALTLATTFAVPGVARAAIAHGDFNRDGFIDVAFGVPDENLKFVTDAGGVDGVYAFGERFDATAQERVVESGQRQALATGYFDRDGYGDLAVGAPSEDYPRRSPTGEPMSPAQDAGGVHILYGSLFGITSLDSEFLRQGALSRRAPHSRLRLEAGIISGRRSLWAT